MSTNEWNIRSKLVSHAVPTLFNVPQNSAQAGDRLGVSGDGNPVPPFGEWISQFHDEFKCLECQPWRLPFSDQEIFESHLQIRHSMAMVDYLRKHGQQGVCSYAYDVKTVWKALSSLMEGCPDLF